MLRPKFPKAAFPARLESGGSRECLFRIAHSLFEGHANEALIGYACADGAFANGSVKLLRQTQVD
jgi:hypothetical protein